MLNALPAWLWSAWSLPPLTTSALLAMLLVYLLGVRRLWRQAGRGQGVGGLQLASFLAGWAFLVIALLSPLDTAVSLLFSAHMAQHLLLAYLAAPLLAYASVGLAAVWALPRTARLGYGRWWRRSPRFRVAVARLTHPATVLLLYVLSFWLWHLPAAYQAALRFPVLHALEHLSMFGSAYLFWWLVIQPLGRRRLGLGATLLYVVAASVQGMVLSSLIVFAPAPLYAGYVTAAQALGVEALRDQQFAGAMMRTLGGLVYLAASVALFLAWIRQMERRDLVAG